MNAQITYEEWHAFLDSSKLALDDEAKTSREIGEELGISKDRVRVWLRDGVEQGWVVPVYVKRKKISGSAAIVPGYKLIPIKTTKTVKKAK